MLFYNEYFVAVCPSYTYEEYTGRDKVEFFVQDIITVKDESADRYDIVGGIEYNPPPNYITDWLFNDTLSDYKYIDTLSPNEVEPLSVLIPSYIDTCGADYEVSLGIPLAAILAAMKIPYAPYFAPLAVMIAPSLSYGESETIYVEAVSIIMGQSMKNST